MEDERKWTFVVDDPWSVSHHLKGGEASRWVDAATWESQECPKIRLGRRVENKSHTTLSPIWYSFFTQIFYFNLWYKVPCTSIYTRQGSWKSHSSSSFSKVASKSLTWEVTFGFPLWYFPKATPILSTNFIQEFLQKEILIGLGPHLLRRLIRRTLNCLGLVHFFYWWIIYLLVEMTLQI